MRPLRWAPKEDNNNVTAYAGAIASALGIAATDSVDLGNDSRLITMLKAMGRHENGVRPPYGDSQYAAALQLL